MNCPHYAFALCAHCFRALTPSQQAAIQQLDGSQAAFLEAAAAGQDVRSRRAGQTQLFGGAKT